ncbi:putative germin-like protein 2-3 [Phtheirospermum japonicum]|uniref:Putative germin-like protein 2-3 n=1 Tax=Phtheirospermum japonicum TaxID=374723 RepID=A0A830BUK1_9LAMI|nr:putative germin-like protein 2-3 [Phtheirospermum japonicum]
MSNPENRLIMKTLKKGDIFCFSNGAHSFSAQRTYHKSGGYSCVEQPEPRSDHRCECRFQVEAVYKWRYSC